MTSPRRGWLRTNQPFHGIRGSSVPLIINIGIALFGTIPDFNWSTGIFPATVATAVILKDN